MSSLAFPTIGKEYYETNIMFHDWFLRSTICLSELFPLWNVLGRFSKHHSMPKVLKTYTSNICLSKVFGDILEKVIYFYFFVSVHQIEESWLYSLVFLFFVGIDNPKSDFLFLFSTWAYCSDVRKSQSILGWLFFFKPHPNPSPIRRGNIYRYLLLIEI